MKKDSTALNGSPRQDGAVNMCMWAVHCKLWALFPFVDAVYLFFPDL